MIYFLTRFVIQTTKGRKNLGNTMVGVNVDVFEILRFALNDTLCVTGISSPLFIINFIRFVYQRVTMKFPYEVPLK